MRTPPIESGLDVFLRDPSPLTGKRIGLLSNAASVTRRFVPAASALADAGVDVRVLFGPEHGFTGAAQDMEPVAGEASSSTARVVSLYGETFEALSPEPEDLDGLDAVVADLPDVGSRYYTFVWTTALLLKACAKRRIPVWLFDRPNPLGGLTVEGNLPEEPLRSFVGLYPVPVRHGMTPGEVARYVNEEFRLGADLTIVLMTEEGRSEPAPRERLGETPAWVLPSPNMPTPDTALVYPGLCLLEGTNLSEGRGTTRPFEIVGAPWLDPERTAAAANALALPGVLFRPHVFKPTFQKFEGEVCGGVALHVTDREAFRPFETGLRLVKALRDADEKRFRWRRKPYEFRDDVPAIDLLAGTARYRELVDAGEPLDEWIASFEVDLARFAPARSRSLLYRTSVRWETGFPPTLLFVGAHESGKTTVLCRVVEALVADGVAVTAIKHTDHDYPTDGAEKDSSRLAAAGAEPAIFVAGERSATHRKHDLRPTLPSFLRTEAAGAAAVLVEGFRHEAFPKIEVVRAATHRAPVAQEDPNVLAVVTDRETFHPATVPRLSFGDFDGLMEIVRRTLRLPRRG